MRFFLQENRIDFLWSTLFIAPPGALVGMAAMMSIVPILCLIGSYFIIKKKYIISEEKYEEILKDLEERKTQSQE